jgi:hypothetical protein
MPNYTPVEFLEEEIQLCSDSIRDAHARIDLACERINSCRAKREVAIEKLEAIENREHQIHRITEDMLKNSYATQRQRRLGSAPDSELTSSELMERYIPRGRHI